LKKIKTFPINKITIEQAKAKDKNLKILLNFQPNKEAFLLIKQPKEYYSHIINIEIKSFNID
jgi:hypothetical protein